MVSVIPASPADLEAALTRARYLADSATALSTWLALKMKRPLLLEGPAGVGKTDLARATAEALGRPLVRLQCYEGLDEAKELYEWDYAKQMLYTQLLRDVVARDVAGATTIAGAAARVAESEASFFNEHFLIARPLPAGDFERFVAVRLLAGGFAFKEIGFRFLQILGGDFQCRFGKALDGFQAVDAD